MADSEQIDQDDNFEDFADEDQETGSLEDEADEIDGETDIDDESQSEDDLEPTDEDAEGGEDDEEADADDNVLVKLESGEEIALSELRSGYMKAKDYTHKTTELAQEREQVDQVRAAYGQRTQFVENVLSNLTTYLEKLVPQEPSLELAHSNPAEYQYQKALRENALGELGQLVQMGNNLGEAKQSYNQEDLAQYRTVEDAKLLKAMPQLADPSARAKFDKTVSETAAEFGFSEEEIAQTADARVKQLVHFARIGKRAIQNRNNAQKRVETPKKGKPRRAAPGTVKTVNARKARARLSKTGSLEDAMNIDFD